MRELGVFARTYARPKLEAVLDAVVADGFTSVQWNMSCAGLPSMPEEIELDLVRRIRDAAAARGIRIAALSGTFNMIHPDPGVRADGLHRLATLAAACAPLGCDVLTVCSGTRDPDDMWRAHPDNGSPAAWADLLASMRAAVAVAEVHGVVLGVEPEPANVVADAAAAHRLLDELGDVPAGIVFDPANLIDGVPETRIAATLDDALALLGERIVLAHGKDRDASGAVVPACLGLVPWRRVLSGLDAAGYRGPLILHGLDEADVPGAVAALRALPA
jgi:sugar phosphate isomerase/epimerase